MKSIHFSLLRLYIGFYCFTGFIHHLESATALPERESLLNQQVLIIINSKSESSKEIGQFYARKRNIQPPNICLIQTDPVSIIERKVYENEIRDPVADHIRKNQLQDQILYIVTTKGVPSIINGDPGIMGDLASVDSELTLLYKYLLGSFSLDFGKVSNPYFTPSLQTGERIPFDRSNQEIYLVTRLSGKTTNDTLTLIEKGQALATDGAFAFDLASQKRDLTYSRFQSAAELLRSMKKTVFFEDTANWLSESDELAGFCIAINQLDQSAKNMPDYKWSPGAIGLLFGGEWSLETNQDGEDLSRSPIPVVNRLIEKGVSGTAIFLADPGAPGFPLPQILFMAYLNGHNLAESFYLATQYLSWRQVVIGDPLMAPFNKTDTVSKTETQFDAETGLPKYFSDRRLAVLKGKYATSEEVLISLLKAEAAFYQGDLSKARQDLEESLRKDPSIIESNFLRAKTEEASGDLIQAVEFYEKALELGYKDELSLYRRLATITLEKLNDPHSAEPYVRWLQGRTGYSDLQVVEYLGQIQLEKGELDSAERTFLRSIRQQNPPPLFALIGLGKVYLEKENLELAEDFLKRAISQPGADAESIESILSEVDNYRTATGTNDEILQDSPSKPDTQGELSQEKLTRRVKILERIQPEYPKQAVKEGKSGYTILRLFVDERGQLLESECLKGERMLCRAAEEAVKKWKFAPKLVNGRPEFDKITVVINFKLEKNKY
jgi:uncharacterized protein (TIGR03790 family)